MKLEALRKPVTIACLFMFVACNKEKASQEVDFSLLSKFAWQHIDHRKSTIVFNDEKPLEYDDTTLAIFNKDSFTVITKSVSESLSLSGHIIKRTTDTLKGAYSINNNDSTIILLLSNAASLYPGYGDSIVSYSSSCKVTILNQKSLDVRPVTDPLTVPVWEQNPLCRTTGNRYTAVKK